MHAENERETPSLPAEVRSELLETLRREFRESLRAELLESVRAQLREELMQSVRAELAQSLREELFDSLQAELFESVQADLLESVEVEQDDGVGELSQQRQVAIDCRAFAPRRLTRYHEAHARSPRTAYQVASEEQVVSSTVKEQLLDHWLATLLQVPGTLRSPASPNFQFC